MPLDIGIGLLLGVLLNSLAGLNYGLCLLIGSLATLWPDADFIWQYIQTRILPTSEHRDGLHYPLIALPLLFIIFLLTQSAISLIFLIGTMAHYIHDSFGVGFGIKWLYPLKKNSYLFLYKANVITNKDMPKKKVYSWNDMERHAAIQKYGNPDWIKLIYFRLHPFGLFEYAVLLLGAAAEIYYRP